MQYLARRFCFLRFFQLRFVSSRLFTSARVGDPSRELAAARKQRRDQIFLTGKLRAHDFVYGFGSVFFFFFFYFQSFRNYCRLRSARNRLTRVK